MDASLLVTLLIGVPTLLTGTYFGLKTVRSVTAADKERVAGGIQTRIDKAVTDANAACAVRVTDLQRDLDAETGRANRAETRADALQTSINERGLGPVR